MTLKKVLRTKFEPSNTLMGMFLYKINIDIKSVFQYFHRFCPRPQKKLGRQGLGD